MKFIFSTASINEQSKQMLDKLLGILKELSLPAKLISDEQLHWHDDFKFELKFRDRYVEVDIGGFNCFVQIMEALGEEIILSKKRVKDAVFALIWDDYL